MVNLIIDDIRVTVPGEMTILDAAYAAGIYIPRLCFHPSLPAIVKQKPSHVVYRSGQPFANTKPDRQYEGCQLCIVRIEGREGFHRACSTKADEGMVLYTNTREIQDFRRDRLSVLMAKHPHACLNCAQKEGCARSLCSMNIPENERCCPRFGNCEFQKLAEYIGLKSDTPRYVFSSLPREETPSFEINYNLCLGCTRCIRACREAGAAGVLDFVFDEEGRVLVGSTDATLAESGCPSCGACVEVCPTGALTNKNGHTTELIFSRPVPAPEKETWKEFTPGNVAMTPGAEGVYRLRDADSNIIYIKGAINLRRELQEQLNVKGKARYFTYTEDPLYTKRESELLQKYLAQHKQMPEINRELEDLF